MRLSQRWDGVFNRGSTEPFGFAKRLSIVTKQVWGFFGVRTGHELATNRKESVREIRRGPFDV